MLSFNEKFDENEKLNLLPNIKDQTIIFKHLGETWCWPQVLGDKVVFNPFIL